MRDNFEWAGSMLGFMSAACSVKGGSHDSVYAERQRHTGSINITHSQRDIANTRSVIQVTVPASVRHSAFAVPLVVKAISPWHHCQQRGQCRERFVMCCDSSAKVASAKSAAVSSQCRAGLAGVDKGPDVIDERRLVHKDGHGA